MKNDLLIKNETAYKKTVFHLEVLMTQANERESNKLAQEIRQLAQRSFSRQLDVDMEIQEHDASFC